MVLPVKGELKLKPVFTIISVVYFEGKPKVKPHLSSILVPKKQLLYIHPITTCHTQSINLKAHLNVMNILHDEMCRFTCAFGKY